MSYDNTCQPLSHTLDATEVTESAQSPGKTWRSVKSPWSKDSCCIPVHWTHQSTGARRWANCHRSRERDKDRKKREEVEGNNQDLKSQRLVWGLTSSYVFPVQDQISCSMREASLRYKHRIYFYMPLSAKTWLQVAHVLLSRVGCLALLTVEKRMLWLECCGVNSGEHSSQRWVIDGIAQPAV